jgi:hypothetical protein
MQKVLYASQMEKQAINLLTALNLKMTFKNNYHLIQYLMPWIKKLIKDHLLDHL